MCPKPRPTSSLYCVSNIHWIVETLVKGVTQKLVSNADWCRVHFETSAL